MEKAPKAYKNFEFLNSRAARELRILAECIEPRDRFQRFGVDRSIVFFGSARLKDKKTIEELKKNAKTDLEKKQLKHMEVMSGYYDAAEELAFKLAEWTDIKHGREDRYYICTGGGPGIMEAANRGAQRYNKDLSIGLNISLPFEQNPNNFISENLNFEFHYFFTRKFWFLKLAEALIVFPGGFGTCDELFELLTLVQTHKVKEVPIILFGKSFWKNLINFDYFVECGLIAKKDLDLFKYVDTADEAFKYLIRLLD